MFTITIFLKSMNALPISMVYSSSKAFDAARNLVANGDDDQTLQISDDFGQSFIAQKENIAAVKFENMDETRKLMIEHNLYQHVTKAMMDARVEGDPRITRTRGAALLNPANMPQFNGPR